MISAFCTGKQKEKRRAQHVGTIDVTKYVVTCMSSLSL
jgi:hypothetical protein